MEFHNMLESCSNDIIHENEGSTDPAILANIAKMEELNEKLSENFIMINSRNMQMYYPL